MKKCDNCLVGYYDSSDKILFAYTNYLKSDFPNCIYNFCPFCGRKIMICGGLDKFYDIKVI